MGSLEWIWSDRDSDWVRWHEDGYCGWFESYIELILIGINNYIIIEGLLFKT